MRSDVSILTTTNVLELVSALFSRNMSDLIFKVVPSQPNSSQKCLRNVQIHLWGLVDLKILQRLQHFMQLYAQGNGRPNSRCFIQHWLGDL